MNAVPTKCCECWYRVPVEEDACPGDEYECENCGASLIIRSNYPLELDRCLWYDVRVAGPPSGHFRIYEGMQIDLFDHVEIADIIDHAKLWDYRRIDLHITLTNLDRNYASVGIRKLT